MNCCRNCGAEIDWIHLEDGQYIPVDPEPVFVIAGAWGERFYDEELGEITGRLAGPEEVRTREAKINTPVAYVPHCRTCRAKKTKSPVRAVGSSRRADTPEGT